MRKYRVYVTRMVEETSSFTIEAKSKREACDKLDSMFDWEICDACGEWAPGDDVTDAEVYHVERVRDEHPEPVAPAIARDIYACK